MNKWYQRLSRRDRIVILIGFVVVLSGVVVYPMMQKGNEWRELQVELLEMELETLQEQKNLLNQRKTIEKENEKLFKALDNANALLFPATENPVLMQTSMVSLFKEIAPELDLDISLGGSTLSDSREMIFTVKGNGRYPEMLKCLDRLENYRPLILVEEFNLEEQRRRRRSRSSRNRRSSREQQTVQQTATEKILTLNMKVRIYTQKEKEK